MLKLQSLKNLNAIFSYTRVHDRLFCLSIKNIRPNFLRTEGPKTNNEKDISVNLEKRFEKLYFFSPHMLCVDLNTVLWRLCL